MLRTRRVVVYCFYGRREKGIYCHLIVIPEYEASGGKTDSLGPFLYADLP